MTRTDIKVIIASLVLIAAVFSFQAWCARYNAGIEMLDHTRGCTDFSVPDRSSEISQPFISDPNGDRRVESRWHLVSLEFPTRLTKISEVERHLRGR